MAMSMSHGILSTLAGLVAGGSVAIVAKATGAQSADVASIPWDKLLGVGSGGLAFGVAWYFLQREERMRSAHERVVEQHLQTASKISTTFADTVNKILADSRADTDRREERLIDLLQSNEK
jgi:shikimate 5-dehydrogenase